MIGAVAAVALRGVGAVARWVPARWASALGSGLGWIWYRLVPVRRGVARANVARALGATLDAAQRERIVRGMYRHLGRAFVELVRGAGRAPEALAAELAVRWC